MKETIKIVSIYHNKNKKNGDPYISKDGKPYEVCAIKTDDGYVNGFANATTRSWKVGDEVELDIIMNGDYKNFKLPNPNVTRQEFDALVKRIETLERGNDMLEDMQ